MLKHNGDVTPRGPSVRLTDDFLDRMGLRCLLIDAIAGQESARLVVRKIQSLKAKGNRVWFRNEKEVEAVSREVFASSRTASRSRDGIRIWMATGQVLEHVLACARRIGITPITDADLITTRNSVIRRIDAAIALMQRDGSMKRINREYSALRQAGTSAGTDMGTGDAKTVSPVPSYSEWLVVRLGEELKSCANLVHITRL